MDPTPAARELALLVADVYELAGALRRSGEELAGRAGQTQARWQLLSVVSEGEWTVAAAARRLGLSRQAVQRVADALVTEDLAAYAPNPAHARAQLVTLTPSGRRALRSITAHARRHHQAVASGLDVDDLAAARRTLASVLAALPQ